MVLGGSSGSWPAPDPKPASTLQEGLRVQVVGLQGTLQSFVPAQGRWRVQLEDGPEILLPESQLEACGQSRQSPAILELRSPGEGELRPGQHVRICQLKAQPWLNGEEGVLLDFDRELSRWKVHMKDGSGKALRAENLEVVEARAEDVPETVSQGEPLLEKHFRAGQLVRIRGLKAQPELNGKDGVLLDFDSEQGRWRVHMSDGSGKALKPQHLELVLPEVPVAKPAPLRAAEEPAASLLGQRVQVRDLQARSELNGLRGWVDGWDEMHQRWQVRMDDQTGKLLKTEHLEVLGGEEAPPVFRDGARVRVHSLKARPDLNGLDGTLAGFEEGEQRWRVLLDGGARLLLRDCNMDLLSNPQEGSLGRPHVAGVETRQEPAPASPEPLPALCPGHRVRISGLQAQPTLNGQEGVLVEFDDALGRWKVAMEDGSGKALKPQHLQLVMDEQDPATLEGPAQAAPQDLVGRRVQICGLRARSDLNGLRGVVDGWDEMHQRWQVRMDDETGKLLKSENLDVVTLTGSARVRVHSLKARPDLNGLDGTLDGFDEAQQRWRVFLDNGAKLLLQEANLDLVDSQTASMASDSPGAKHDFQPGQRVRIVSLQAQPALNGMEGILIDFDHVLGRWKVHMDDGTGKALKPAHLQLVTDAPQDQEPNAPEPASPPSVVRSDLVGRRVQICGLRARTDLNGLSGTVDSWDESERRWKVRMDDESCKLLKVENLEVLREEPALSAGSRIRVHSIQARPELNGQRGSLVSFDPQEERWRVLLDDGARILLRAANLECLEHEETPPTWGAMG